ncbi:unnamed protein product, partial [Ilex paraguariensis]
QGGDNNALAQVCQSMCLKRKATGHNMDEEDNITNKSRRSKSGPKPEIHLALPPTNTSKSSPRSSPSKSDAMTGTRRTRLSFRRIASNRKNKKRGSTQGNGFMSLLEVEIKEAESCKEQIKESDLQISMSQ